MSKKISSWGNIEKLIITNTNNFDSPVIVKGNLNSYGDACLPLEGKFYENKIISEGMVNPNKTIFEIINKNKFLYAIPGKSNVTIGGAVAADTHGKDSSWGGSFINNVEELDLLISTGEVVRCSRKINSEVFYATVGGYGLTGVISGIKLRKHDKFFTETYLTKNINGLGINSLLKNFSNNHGEYSVAWVDLLSKDKNWVLEISKPIIGSSLKKINIKENNNKELNFSIPIIGKNYLNSLKMINNIFYTFNSKNKEKISKLEKVLFPLNFVSNTKNISKKRKIVQIQFSIPIHNQHKLNELIDCLIFKQKPLLCSVKKLGDCELNNGISFLQNGWTVAVDFSYFEFNEKSIRNFYKKLIDLEGKIYLAKDSTLNEREFKNMYPAFENWQKIVKDIDPKNIFQSKMSQRLGIKLG